MSVQYKFKQIAGTSAADGSAEVLLNRDSFGYDPSNLYAQHAISCTLSAGSWNLQVCTPSGAFVDVVTGCDGNDLVMVGPKGVATLGSGPSIAAMNQAHSAYLRSTAYKIIVANNGNAQPFQISIRSDAVAW